LTGLTKPIYCQSEPGHSLRGNGAKLLFRRTPEDLNSWGSAVFMSACEPLHGTAFDYIRERLRPTYSFIYCAIHRLIQTPKVPAVFHYLQLAPPWVEEHPELQRVTIGLQRKSPKSLNCVRRSPTPPLRYRRS